MTGAHALRTLGRILRNAFARETLDGEPEEPPGPHSARSLARALFAIEELPLDPENPSRPSRGAGVLRALLFPEPLTEEPPEPPRRTRHPWLAWLLGPESLDPPQ
jgi:hypothetical protein